jgi:hypothetical protein
MSTWAGPLIAPMIGAFVPATVAVAGADVAPPDGSGDAETALDPGALVDAVGPANVVVAIVVAGVLGESELHAPIQTSPPATTIIATPLRMGRDTTA